MQSINRLIEKSKNARRAFTVLELLVASMLLGMLMSILTMIFNQSSIAWRTGVAGVADLDDVREKIAEVRYESDNAYAWKGQAKCVRSLFDDTGALLTDRQIADFPGGVKGISSSITDDDANRSYSFSSTLKGTSQSRATYVVNVMSAGPDRTMDTYDDIWSFPDDPNEW